VELSDISVTSRRLGEANVSTPHVRLRCYLRPLYFSFCLCAHGRRFIPQALVPGPGRDRIGRVSAARPQTVSAAGGCNIKYLAISGRTLRLSTYNGPYGPAPLSLPAFPCAIDRGPVEYSRQHVHTVHTDAGHAPVLDACLAPRFRSLPLQHPNASRERRHDLILRPF
jgi:hypothetical protein